ncbi:MAG: M23 family metallopeptidase [Rhodothermaceae bacterium]|nr:M23 family metallopeptidase [Rhodothermaceae bacterium]
MAKNRYYYYDEETFSFVELKPKRSKVIKKAAMLLLASVILAGAISWGMDKVIGTPQELSLLEENEALQEQLTLVKERMNDFSDQLSALAEHDQELYRTILQADPISNDMRMVGVGGNDVYEEFNRFSPAASEILKETAVQLDELERKVNLQNHSYRELSALAGKRNDWLVQMPAIMPVDGKITSGFGMRFHPILRIRRMHAGIDFSLPTGTPIRATGDGVIKKAGQNSGLGKYIEVHHPATGYITVYGHLSSIPDNIRVGKKVKRGEQIGLSGNTGLSSAPHLHYEVRDKNRKPINPVLFFLPSMTPEQYQELFADAENSTSSLD